MIYTVTLNPALDLIYKTNKINKDGYTYADASYKFPGGKALNVTRMLHNLNIPSIALGFLGGYSGNVLRDWFEDENVENFFLEIEDSTRINSRIRTKGEELTIAGVYPRVPKDKIEILLTYLSKLREGDILVMGGSIPQDVEKDIYTRIAEIAKANKADFVIDIAPKKLKSLLSYKPLLIKPNIKQLAEMFDLEKISTEIDIINYGKKCVELGAKNVIVSVGEEGSYLFTSDGKSYRSWGVKGKEINSFNSRDAMIGGFIGIYMRTNDPIQSFKMAAAAASATAFEEDLASGEHVKEIYEKTVVEEIEI